MADHADVSEVCPFCGAGIDNPGEPFTWYECETTYGTETDDPPVWSRGETCYERQIANLRALLREAVGRLKKSQSAVIDTARHEDLWEENYDFIIRSEVKAAVEE